MEKEDKQPLENYVIQVGEGGGKQKMINDDDERGGVKYLCQFSVI